MRKRERSLAGRSRIQEEGSGQAAPVSRPAWVQDDALAAFRTDRSLRVRGPWSRLVWPGDQNGHKVLLKLVWSGSPGRLTHQERASLESAVALAGTVRDTHLCFPRLLGSHWVRQGLVTVSEFVPDATSLAAPGRMSLSKVLDIGVHLAGAVVHLHQHGVCHGDIAAENVLVSTTGSVYLVDFDAADFSLQRMRSRYQFGSLTHVATLEDVQRLDAAAVANTLVPAARRAEQDLPTGVGAVLRLKVLGAHVQSLGAREAASEVLSELRKLSRAARAVTLRRP